MLRAGFQRAGVTKLYSSRVRRGQRRRNLGSGNVSQRELVKHPDLLGDCRQCLWSYVCDGGGEFRKMPPRRQQELEY